MLGGISSLPGEAPAVRQQRLEEIALAVRGLAHDFSNVLTGILGFAELTQGRLENTAAVKRNLAEIVRAAQQGVKAVQELQMFTRRNKVNPGSCSLATLLNEDNSALRQRLGSVGWRIDLPADLPPVAVEITALRQLLICLLDNARTASRDQGEVSLTARLAELSPNDCPELFGSPAAGPVVELLVSDRGTGLTENVQRRLFTEPFFSTRPGHRGMGLAMVYGIVQAYHGGFRLDPGPDGQGAVARVVLPVAPAPQLAGRKRSDPSVDVADDARRRLVPQKQ